MGMAADGHRATAPIRASAWRSGLLDMEERHMNDAKTRAEHLLSTAKDDDTIVVGVATADGFVVNTMTKRPWDMVQMARVLVDTALEMEEQQPEKDWDAAATIGEALNDLTYEKDCC
jgi:hypothetical protein